MTAADVLAAFLGYLHRQGIQSSYSDQRTPWPEDTVGGEFNLPGEYWAVRVGHIEYEMMYGSAYIIPSVSSHQIVLKIWYPLRNPYQDLDSLAKRVYEVKKRGGRGNPVLNGYS
ncbi:hypothetical protein MNV49_005497 [Pseudohyphozyma bogoriensis]|nr:hypothetical protein MNV49_005497 [Pseudohyphozyma bogoriensis]